MAEERMVNPATVGTLFGMAASITGSLAAFALIEKSSSGKDVPMGAAVGSIAMVAISTFLAAYFISSTARKVV